ASMWRLRPDGTTDRILTDLTISNGLAFSADGTHAYYVDTPTGRVDVFDWDETAGLVERRTFADLGAQEGAPDGLTLDGEGKVWVAMHSGHQVLGLDEHGQVAEKIAVGARQVTPCTFGGPDRSTLFITTSRENLHEGEDPAAGSLFAAQPAVRGAVERRLFAAGPFGGPARSPLLIAPGRENLPEGEDPAAGSLCAPQPGVRGAVEEGLFAA